MGTRLQRTTTYLKYLLKNPYFWMGLGGLFFTMMLLYLVFNFFVMPTYTRQNLSLTVPDVRNRPYAEAQRVLEEAGMRVERITQRYNAQYDKDEVIDQDPAPETPVKPNRRVYLTVNSSEMPRVAVPTLNGMSLREALNRLLAVNLVLDQAIEDTIPSPYPNTVTGQTPAAGSQVEEGSGVTVWYSTGLGTEQVAVPDVTNKTVSEATEALLAVRLRSLVVGGGAEAENAVVLRQSHAPGTMVRAGEEIRLFTTPEQDPQTP